MAAQSKGTLNLILVGKTGSGKSTSGDTILDDKVFDRSSDFESATTECSLQKRTVHGWDVNLVDSPGLMDTNLSVEETGVMVVKTVINTHPGFDGVLYVIRYGARYTKEDLGAYNRFKMLFGSNVTSHVTVIFTGGDNIQAGTDFDQKLRKAPKELRDVLDDCNWRYVIFNNMRPNDRDQVARLLDTVDDMRSLNKGLPYACSTYSKIGDTLEEQVGKRIREIEEQEARANEYIQRMEGKLLEELERVDLSREMYEKEVADIHEKLKTERRKMTEEWEEKLKREKEEQERKHRHLEEQAQKERDRADHEKRLREIETRLLQAKNQTATNSRLPSGDAVVGLVGTLAIVAKEIAVAVIKK